jgi:23S rRNA (pseudouridine1915-N3)-methyltransferase
MRLLIAAVGRLKQGPERELFTHYVACAEALGRKLKLKPLTTVEISESRAQDEPERMRAEAKALLGKISPGDKLICLDRRGDDLDSVAFSLALKAFRDNGAPGLAYVIGGPDGLASAALDRANLIVSFGRITLPHGLVRIVLAEQIYRAMTILSGHPYHRA